MNVIATATEHIAARTYESQRHLPIRDGTRVSFDTLLIFKFPSMNHIIIERKIALANFIAEILQKTSKASRAIPVPTQIDLKVFRFEYIRGCANLTLEDNDAKTKNN